MNRKQIEQAAIEFGNGPWPADIDAITDNSGSLVWARFTIQQVNAALEEAARLAHAEQSRLIKDGQEHLPINALDEFAYAIRGLKIK